MLALIKKLLKRIPGIAFLYRKLVRFSARYVRPRVNGFVAQKMLRLSKDLPTRQTYFSIYEIWPMAPAVWVKNQQLWFREKINNTEEDPDLIHFLGAPLVEREGLAEDVYLGWLRGIVAQHEQKEFVYIMHPRESNEWGLRVSKILRVPVRRYQLPYEIELCMMARRPKVVASWFCSALDNLAECNVVGLELLAYRLPSFQLPKDRLRQAKILEAAELFYTRHEKLQAVKVLAIPASTGQVSQVSVGVEVKEADLFVQYNAYIKALRYQDADEFLQGCEGEFLCSASYWAMRADVSAHQDEYELAIDFIDKSISFEPACEYIKRRIDYKRKLGFLFGNIDDDFKAYISLAKDKGRAFYEYFSFVWEREGVSEHLMTQVQRSVEIVADGSELKKGSREARNYGNLLLLQASMLASFGALSAAHKKYNVARDKYGAVDNSFIYLKYSIQKNKRIELLARDRFKQVDALVSSQGRLRELLLASKGSVCVVGNSPSVRGVGAGKYIDNARLVIRLNNYSTDYPYREDVGSKTDVWVRMPFHPYVKRSPESNLKLVVFSGSNRLVRPTSIMHDVIEYAGQNAAVDFFEPEIFYELQKELGRPPTAGLYVLYLIYKVLGPLLPEQYYGFSFDDKGEGIDYHFSDRNASAGRRHSWGGEAEVFNRIKAEKNHKRSCVNLEHGLEPTASLTQRFDTVITTSPGLVDYEIFGVKPRYVSVRKCESHIAFKDSAGKDGSEAEELASLSGRTCIVGFGRAKTGIMAEKLAGYLGCEFYLSEYGLISSMHLPSEKQFNFSLILDDRGIFYDTTNHSMIEEILYSNNHIFDPHVQNRARRAIQRIVKGNITKYNNSPDAILSQGDVKKRILVVDQTANDNSIIYGQCEKYRFIDMLEFALAQDAHVIVKTHPETSAGAKGGNITDLERYRENNNLTIIHEQCNIVSLIKQVDEVYVMTSGVGLEALIVGKKVRCFGVPFYAGWGLTTDMTEVTNRRRAITVDSLFAAVFFYYTKYYDPLTKSECELEDCLSWVEANKESRDPVTVECIS